MYMDYVNHTIPKREIIILFISDIANKSVKKVYKMSGKNLLIVNHKFM